MRRLKFIDIGANLTDLMYEGLYNGSKKHTPDLERVLERSFQIGGIQKMILTGGSLSDSEKSIGLSKSDSRLFSTVGCHPTRCNEIVESGDPNEYIKSMGNLIEKNSGKVVAIGEIGLDKDRTMFCDFETQKKYFDKQLDYFGSTFNLPLFLHCRNAGNDMIEILHRHRAKFTRSGVVHSFDGTLEEAKAIIDQGYFIGINGCSLKTEDNLKVIADIPSDKIMIETDCPWCEIRPSHAGHKYISTKFDQLQTLKKEKWKDGALVKNRNEPLFIVHVLEIIAGVKGVDPNELAETIFKTTEDVFFH